MIVLKNQISEDTYDRNGFGFDTCWKLHLHLYQIEKKYLLRVDLFTYDRKLNTSDIMNQMWNTCNEEVTE